MPTNLNELIWYLLVGMAGILLYNIRSELKGMRDDLKGERLNREILAHHVNTLENKVTAIDSRCIAYHGERRSELL